MWASGFEDTRSAVTKHTNAGIKRGSRRKFSWSDFRGATLDTTRKIAIFSYFYINTYFQRVSQNDQINKYLVEKKQDVGVRF